MDVILLISLCVGLSTAFRGPHHPRSTVSHHHYSPQSNVKITQDAELLQDTTHLKEDIGPMSDQLDFSQMTDQEIEFYYFQVHDNDNNTKLDGLEMLYALQHSYHEDNLGESRLPFIVDLIDKVLEDEDLDNDGYLGYVEYVLGRQRDHIVRAKRNI